jgi:hypothetical protein
VAPAAGGALAVDVAAVTAAVTAVDMDTAVVAVVAVVDMAATAGPDPNRPRSYSRQRCLADHALSVFAFAG